MNALLAPTAGAQAWVLPAGRMAKLRPLTPADVDAERRFFNGLSLGSRHQRFHFGLRELSPALLTLLTEVDQRLHCAWVLELATESGPELIADARFVRDTEQPSTAEFALAVADDWQGRGLGRRLLAHLVADARRRGVRMLYGDVLAENRRMLGLMKDTGMRLEPHPEGPQLLRATIELARLQDSMKDTWRS